MPISYRPMREFMKAHGISYYRLGNEGIDPQTQQRIRHDLPLTTTTIDLLCRIMDCQPGDLMEYVPEKEENHSDFV